jgi:hypothetical protein
MVAMRLYGKFTYSLTDEKNGIHISQVKSGVELFKGDELNFNGNKLIVKDKDKDKKLLTVERIGFAVIVK